MSQEILRYVDSIAREKDIDKEGLFEGIEQAVGQALSKKYGLDDLELTLNRESGQWNCNYEVDLESQGRILAQSVKQAIVSKVREAERDVLYDEFEAKIGQIVNGTVQRFEGDTVWVNLGKNMEGILPRAEKVRSEIYNNGDRIRAMVLEVKKIGPRLKIILTRAHRDLVRCLFELEVPEIADSIIEIRRIEREPGYRTKLAVHSSDSKVDCVGACVGVRGTRIKSIIDELNGERIDIIRWSDESETLIANALKPAEISHIQLDPQSSKALVLVDEDQLSLAIGRRGQNVRLASKMTGWEIDIMTRAELEKSIAEEDSAELGGEATGDDSAETAEATENDAAEATGDDSAETAEVTEDGVTEDGVTEDSAAEATGDDSAETAEVTEDEVTEDGVTEDGVTEDSAAEATGAGEGAAQAPDDESLAH